MTEIIATIKRMSCNAKQGLPLDEIPRNEVPMCKECLMPMTIISARNLRKGEQKP